MPEQPPKPATALSPARVDDAAKRPPAAAASVVLGVVGILSSFLILPGAICGVAAVATARQAARQTGPDTGRPGRGLAVAGQALGVFALVLCAVFSAIVLVSVLTVPRDRGHSKMQQATQLRGIHMGLVVYANTNKEHFPGLDSKGHILLDSEENTGLSGDGDTVQARYWILLDEDFFTPEYAIAPRETDTLVVEYEPSYNGTVNPVRWDAGASHYSFAMLSINGEPGQAPDAETRSSEWGQLLNDQAIVMSDRNQGADAADGVFSNYAERPGEFRGSVLWNDNHVEFVDTHILETRYGTGPVHADARGNPTDNLFLNQGDDDAYLIHEGD